MSYILIAVAGRSSRNEVLAVEQYREAALLAQREFLNKGQSSDLCADLAGTYSIGDNIPNNGWADIVLIVPAIQWGKFFVLVEGRRDAWQETWHSLALGGCATLQQALYIQYNSVHGARIFYDPKGELQDTLMFGEPIIRNIDGLVEVDKDFASQTYSPPQ